MVVKCTQRYNFFNNRTESYWNELSDCHRYICIEKLIRAESVERLNLDEVEKRANLTSNRDCCSDKALESGKYRSSDKTCGNRNARGSHFVIGSDGEVKMGHKQRNTFCTIISFKIN